MEDQYPIGYIISGYKCIEYLGSGSFGKVYKGISINDASNIIALKIIQKSKFQNEGNQKKRQIIQRLLKTQIQILRKCKSDYIMKFIGKYQNQSEIILLLEYCNDGDLMQYIRKRKKIPQQEAVKILTQIINGFKDLHKNLIIHRDLKPQNIFKHNDRYKIGDLGFAKVMESFNQVSSKTVLGTLKTMAPEIIRRQTYGIKADLWSLGIVYYQMIYGTTPFAGKTLSQIKLAIRNQLIFENISQQSKDFLQKILVVDVQKRMNWSQVYNHKLLNKYKYIMSQNDEQDLYQSKMIHQNLQIKQNQLKRNPEKELQQFEKKQDEIKYEEKKFEKVQKMQIQKINQQEKLKQKQNIKQRQEIQQNLNEKINQTLKNYIFQKDKTMIIQQRIIDPITKLNPNLKDRKFYQFLYLLTCRQFFIISPIYNHLKNPKANINKNQHYKIFFQQLEDWYQQIVSSRQTLSKSLLQQQNKLKQRVFDFYQKWTKYSKYSKQEKILCGIEGQDFIASQQIQFTINEYFPKLLPKIEKQSNFTYGQKQQFKYFFKHYNTICTADFINQPQVLNRIKNEQY